MRAGGPQSRDVAHTGRRPALAHHSDCGVALGHTIDHRTVCPVAHTICLPRLDPFVMPILASIPVQLLAYHAAVLKGTDVDQPRNLAKSVTVE